MNKELLYYLTNDAGSLTLQEILLSFACAVVLGAVIFVSYRFCHTGAVYSAKFNVSLWMMTLVTTLIMCVIGNNIALSLGMVGALSIVRFRTAIKDPLDLMFLFWAISIGIICGAGMAQIAIILSVGLTVGLLFLDKLPVAKAPMILVVNAQGLETEDAVCQAVAKYAKHYSVKSRNVSAQTLDLVLELRTAQGAELVRAVNALEGVQSVSLMSHDGEVSF